MQLTDAVHVWSANTNHFANKLAHFTRLLSDDEIRRAERFKFAKDRTVYVVTKGILREILSQYLSVDPTAIQFYYNQWGKPYLENNDLKFNLSHSHELSVYAMTLHSEVGIDIEYIQRKVEALELAKRFFAKAEYEQLSALPEKERQSAFFHTWTRKEAFVKALGKGLHFSLQDFTVSVLPGQAQLLEVKGQRAEDWTLQQLDLADNYVGTLALANKINQLVQYQY